MCVCVCGSIGDTKMSGSHSQHSLMCYMHGIFLESPRRRISKCTPMGRMTTVNRTYQHTHSPSQAIKKRLIVLCMGYTKYRMIRAAGSPEFERVVSKQRSIGYVIYRGDKPNNNIYFVRTYSWAELIERRQTKQQYILVFRANVHSWAALIKNLSWDVLFLIFLFCIWMFSSSLFVMLMTYIYIYTSTYVVRRPTKQQLGTIEPYSHSGRIFICI